MPQEHSIDEIGFKHVIKDIGLAILKRQKGRLVSSIILDTLNALTRIGAVFVLSLFITNLQSQEELTVFGFAPTLPTTLIGKVSLAAATVSGLFALSTIFNFVSIVLARRMARKLNEEIITDVIDGLAVPPHLAVHTVHRPVNEFNRMLTQNGFHYGMMGESLVRMANPLILFVMACATIMVLSPAFGLGALVLSLLFIPVFAKLISHTRAIAQNFYADQAAHMGMGVSNAVLELGTQYGGFTPESDYAQNFPSKPFMEKFLTAFDKNILANERMSFAVGLVGALIIFMIILASGILYAQGVVDGQAMITIIGAFVFLMTSTRTLASHITNLIRFFPQVKFILEFLTPLRVRRKLHSIPQVGFSAVKSAIQSHMGISDLGQTRYGIYTGQPISKFTLNPYLGLTGNSDIDMSSHTQFINASYRFRQDTPLIDLLAPSGRSAFIESAARTLGVWNEYSELPDGLNTIMTETVWNSLSGEARTAMRLLPLAVGSDPKFIFLDVGVISNLNPLSFEEVFSIFENKVVFIVLNEQYCPDNLIVRVITLSGENATLLSLPQFLTKPLPKRDNTTSGEPNISLATTI